MLALLIVLIAACGQPVHRSGADGGTVQLKSREAGHRTLDLSGRWFYRFGVVDTPGPADSTYSLQPFPMLWTEAGPGRAAKPAQGSATFKLKLTADSVLTGLGLEIPDVYTSFVLYLDTVEVARNGEVALNGRPPVPQWLPVTVPLPDIRGDVWLTLQVSNDAHSKGGVRLPLLLGPVNGLLWKRDVRLALDWLLAGSLLLSGLFMLGLYSYSRYDRAMLYFGLMSVTWSYRVVGYGSYALNTVLPTMPWSVGLHLEYITLFLTTIWFALYVHALFPAHTSKRFLYGLVTMSATFGITVLVAPPVLFTRLVTPFFYFLIPSLLYGVLVYVRAARDRRAGAKLSLLATGVLFVLFSYNILAYFGLFPEQPVMSFLAYFVFFVIQSVILGVRYAESLQKAVAEMKSVSELKGRFLAQMSHELRTPLNAIIGYAQVLSSDTALGARPRKHVTILQNSAQHLLGMINEILDFSRLEAGEIKLNRNSFKLSSLAGDLQQMFQLQADEKHLQFHVEVQDDRNLLLRADEVRIRQVLINLIGNALKFTDRGEVRVLFSLKPDQGDTALLVASVRDTGPGIAAGDRAAIFEPFRQASGKFSQGTGLGLAITARLLDLMEGSIRVDSEPGAGSVFTMEVPVQLLEAERPLPAAPEASALRSGLRVLAVDDVKANADMLAAMLSTLGFEVTAVRSAADARSVFRPGAFDVLLLDINMPVESGIALLESLRVEYGIAYVPPAIALTADITHREDVLKRQGFEGVVYKPFDQALLLARIAASARPPEMPANPDAEGSTQHLVRELAKLDVQTGVPLIEALTFADAATVARIAAELPESVLRTRLERALQDRDFKFLMELGQAAEEGRF